jgi:hypothetical protein
MVKGEMDALLIYTIAYSLYSILLVPYITTLLMAVRVASNDIQHHYIYFITAYFVYAEKSPNKAAGKRLHIYCIQHSLHIPLQRFIIYPPPTMNHPPRTTNPT